MVDSDKHSSLLGYGINYGDKKFYSTSSSLSVVCFNLSKGRAQPCLAEVESGRQ
jgi:hypothetical protein